MKHLLQIICLTLIFSSCSKQSELSKTFDCSNTNTEQKSAQYDFHKNFKLQLPTSWKTELYYNNFQSEIFSADTVKELTKTYILDASHNLGNIEFNDNYFIKNDSTLKVNNLTIIKSNSSFFKEKPSFWYVANGIKKGYAYHQFNLTVVLGEQSYFNSFIEIYGEEAINERLCDAISIIESIEFLQ